MGKLKKKNNKDKKLWPKLLLQHKPNKLLSKMKIGEAKLLTGPTNHNLELVELLDQQLLLVVRQNTRSTKIGLPNNLFPNLLIGPLKLLLQWVEVLPNGVDHPTGTKFHRQGSRQEKKKIIIDFVKYLKRIFFSTSAKNKKQKKRKKKKS